MDIPRRRAAFRRDRRAPQVHSWDDACCVKTTTADVAARIRFERLLVSTRKSSFKVGTETLGRVEDVSFATCDAFDAGRGLAIYAKDGGAVRDVSFVNVTVDLYAAYPDEPEAGRPIDFELEHRYGYSTTARVRVENAALAVHAPLTFKGNGNATLRGVLLENTTLRVGAPAAVLNKTYLVDCHNDAIAPYGVSAANLVVDWDGHRDQWRGLAAAWPEQPPASDEPVSLCPCRCARRPTCPCRL